MRSPALAVIQNQYFGGSVDPGRVAVAALYHDASEILTGDLPTPIKYDNPDIQSAYQQVEAVAVGKLLSMLLEELRPAYEEALTIPDPEVRALVKAADKLSALIKCLEERLMGNTDFLKAEESLWKAERGLHLPEADCFLDEFLPAYSLTLDETQPGQLHAKGPFPDKPGTGGEGRG